jgi:hypothetical protein
MSRATPRSPAEAPPLNAAELRLLSEREKKAQDKRASRARLAQAKAQAAVAPNADGYVVPPMPSGLSAIRKWVRSGHDAYSRRAITILELTEMRRSASNLGDLYKAGAVVRQSFAAERAALAQERMAEVLAEAEHGKTAVLLLSRLQDSLSTGPRRPLPGRVHQLTPAPPEPAS